MATQTSSQDFDYGQSSQPHDSNMIYVAVMGLTGAGKSTFINLISGSTLKESNKLESCTEVVQAGEAFELDGRMITLIDTPGFDDSTRSQMTILKEIASHLENQYKFKIVLHGVLYLHRITDNRMGGIARRNLYMFKKLVGEESFQNVTLVTTMWDKVTEQEGVDRLQELSSTNDLFKPLLDKGAHVARYDKTVESARAIMRRILQNHPMVLKIQRELVDDQKNISDTAAGQEVDHQVLELIKKHQQEMEELKQEMRDAIARRDQEAQEDLKNEKDKLQAAVNAALKERQNMSTDYDRHASLMHENYKQLLEMQKEVTDSKLALFKAEMSAERAEQRATDDRLRAMEAQLAQKKKGGCVIC